MKGFVNPGLTARGLMEGRGEAELEAQTSLQKTGRPGSMGGGTGGAIGGTAGNGSGGGLSRKMSGRRIRDFVKGLTGSGNKDDAAVEDEDNTVAAADGSRVEAIEPRAEKGLRRVLYTANVGDARAVLWCAVCVYSYSS